MNRAPELVELAPGAGLPPSAAEARAAVPGADALISLREAAVRFGAVQALAPTTLSIHRGERVALVGANGSGKTTLLRLLHGLVPAQGQRLVGAAKASAVDAGDAGAPLPARPPVLAMVFQRPFLLELSVRRNLQLALWLAGVPRAERAERARDALTRVGLQGLEERRARALSGGQQQRLTLARAWAMRPDLLLLDEPTASLDPGAKREVEALVDDFARHGMTVVMSTHNLGQVKRLASRVLFLDRGHLLVDRPTDRFFNDPLPEAAAQFLRGELPWVPPGA